MAATGTGVAFGFANTLFIYGGNGQSVAAIAGAPSSAPYPNVSSPVTGSDGSIYFADSRFAYRLDGSGNTVWKTATPGTGGGSAASPVLDGDRLYVPAINGTLAVLAVADGQLLSTPPLGLASGQSGYIYAGAGNVLFMDHNAAAGASGTATEGLFSAAKRGWVGDISIGAGAYPPSSLVGYDIGIVASAAIDIRAETTEVDIIDTCGRLRWRVPGSYAVPLVITFDDDLIVMDRVPNGHPSPLNHDYALRRFSKDGTLLAGPVSVPDQFCGRAFVGADDTFYYTGGSSDGYRLRAYDASLNQLWTTSFPHCSDAAVLNSDGKLFTARGVDGKLAAVQTTSPGPAPVSWSHAAGRDARATKWLAP